MKVHEIPTNSDEAFLNALAHAVFFRILVSSTSPKKATFLDVEEMVRKELQELNAETFVNLAQLRHVTRIVFDEIQKRKER